jgi:hypothetical protein
MANEIARVEPTMSKTVQMPLDSSVRDFDFIQLDQRAFASTEKIDRERRHGAN